MRTLIVFALAIAAVAAFSDPNRQRIVGGDVTTIDVYPGMAAILSAWGTAGHRQSCGGSILNNRSILTAAHCTIGQDFTRWQVRLGSTYANSGGTVYTTALIINHPSYNIPIFLDNDISILRVSSNIIFSNVVQPSSIAGPNYNLADNEVVWAAGWGAIYEGGPSSEQLRHVQIWTVNQVTCRNNYGSNGLTITDNMLCAGWLGVGGRDQCQMDSGGPLYHQGVVVGVCSFGNRCGRPNYPGVNARVSRYTAWIQANA